ncbi:MAG: hypothetical protein WCW35_09260 [Bacteroidota bacterium]|jgi:hypothetical protein
MKTLFFLLCVWTVSLFAQNPDGKNASLHLTPSWQWGSASINRNTSVWLPASLSYEAQYSTSPHAGTLQFPYAFGIHAIMKVPATSYLTMSFSYSLNQRFEEDTDYRNYWRMNGNLHRVDLTVSVYNLFSLYQGD